MATKRRGIKPPAPKKITVMKLNGFTTILLPASDNQSFVLGHQLANRLAIAGRQEESTKIREASDVMRKEYLDYVTNKSAPVEAVDASQTEATEE